MNDPATAGGAAPDGPRDPVAALRSRAYLLFSEAFAYPRGAASSRLVTGELVAELRACLALLPYPVAEPAPAVTPALATLQQRYSALFDVAAGRPAVSLLERRYGEEGEQRLWEALLAFYTHFGLDFSSGGAPEQPDHLLTELGFVHYLAFLEADAARGVADLRRGQRDFLALHLARWAPAMAEKLAAADGAAPYAAIAALLTAFVTADLAHLDALLAPGR